MVLTMATTATGLMEPTSRWRGLGFFVSPLAAAVWAVCKNREYFYWDLHDRLEPGRRGVPAWARLALTALAVVWTLGLLVANVRFWLS